MEEKQKAILEGRFNQFYVKGWDELLLTLTKHGGEMLVPTPEPARQVRWLLDAGQLFDTTRLKYHQCMSGCCHENSGAMWAKDQDLEFVTGYGLSGELWVPHAWLWDSRNVCLVETTEKMEKYFGVVVSDDQVLAYAWKTSRSFWFWRRLRRAWGKLHRRLRPAVSKKRDHCKDCHTMP